LLEVRPSSIAASKKGNTIPPSWYVGLFDKFGLSQDWLRHGVGPMYLHTEQGYIPQAFPADRAGLLVRRILDCGATRS
jgi:hypothetical protein